SVQAEDGIGDDLVTGVQTGALPISMEMVAYAAYWASTELAEERGRYSSFPGSLWDRGILPPDTLDLLAAERGGYVELDRSSHLDWDALRARIQRHEIGRAHV